MLQCSKLFCFYNKASIIPFNCSFTTYKVLRRRFKNLYLKGNKICGPLDDTNDKFDDEYSGFNEEGEQDFDNINFAKLDLAHDEYYREKKEWRDKIAKKITIRKFFSPGRQPLMLTYNEKECIRYLNKKDPIQWNIEALSESFPATPDIIIKVLKSSWRPSPEDIKRMDIKVQQNWALLKEGKLDASPHLIEHLKKFTDRRELLLKDIKNSSFYLPEIKEKEKVWNNGEMNEILSYYERAVNKLHGETTGNKLSAKESELKALEGKNSEPDINVVPYSQNNSKQENLIIKDRQESMTMEKMLSNFKESMTLEDFKTKVVQKAEAKFNLGKREKTVCKSIFDGNSSLTSSSENIKPILNNVQNTRKAYKQYDYKLPKQFMVKENSISINDELVDKDCLVNEKEILDQLTEKNEFQNFQKYNNTKIFTKKNLDGKPTYPKVFSASCVDEIFEHKNEKVETSSKKEDARIKFKKFIEKSPESLEKDNNYFKKEEEDLKSTAFWNEKNSFEEKKIIEEKKLLNQPKDIDKVTMADVCSTDSFPLRIRIPKSRQGSGLIFKVRDCYYDDDGEFLYRVPGMTS